MSRSSEPNDDRRVMITLPPAPKSVVIRDQREIATSYRLRMLAAWDMESIGQRCIVYEVPPWLPFDTTLDELAADPRIDLAQPVQRFRTGAREASPTRAGARDPYRHLQHAADSLGLERAHRHATGRGVRLAVIDTGVDVAHPDLAPNLELARDFVAPPVSFTRDIHGTAVSGVIAAAANDVGILGVAPHCRLLALKACWPEATASRAATCDSYTLALALDSAIVEAVQVVNLSLGGPPDPILGRLVAEAVARGILVVAADGGPGADFPATAPGVLAVRAQPASGTVTLVDESSARISAPGDSVLSTAPGGGFDFFSGASIAAAHVAGLAALLLERRPDLSPSTVARVLLRASQDDALDACAVLAAATGDDLHCEGSPPRTER